MALRDNQKEILRKGKQGAIKYLAYPAIFIVAMISIGTLFSESGSSSNIGASAILPLAIVIIVVVLAATSLPKKK